MSIILDGTSGITTPGETNTGNLSVTGTSTLTGAVNGAKISPYTMKNRIINGAMVIDQRNAGATSTASGVFTVDRFEFQTTQASKFTWGQNYGGVTPPAGFSNYLGFKTTTAYTIGAGDYFFFGQKIEGFNIADLAWGTANAKTITISFWVYSSLTGTFGGAIENGAGNRSYPFSYTISSANTWEQKTITIAGDTTGTWATNNTAGLRLWINLGTGSTYSGTAGSWVASDLFSSTGATSVVGTLNATFYITGVQLEVGSTATAFEWRPYTTELQLCQRYYYLHATGGAGVPIGYATNYTASVMLGYIQFPTTMRSSPTLSAYTGASGYYFYRNGGSQTLTTLVLDCVNSSGYSYKNTTEISGTAGQAGVLQTGSSSSYIAFTAEL